MTAVNERAIDAAAKALLNHSRPPSVYAPDPWTGLTKTAQARYRAEAQAALTAALPYLRLPDTSPITTRLAEVDADDTGGLFAITPSGADTTDTDT